MIKQNVALYICLKITERKICQGKEKFVKGKVEILQGKILPTFTNFSTVDKLIF